MISVLTPTVRDEGLRLVEKSLKRQTVGIENIEWIIGSPFKPEVNIPHIWVKDLGKKEGDFWSIYSVYNDMVRKASSDILISWQDHTYLQPDGLERFQNHYLRDKSAVVGAVGNKYLDETFDVMTWKDPRETDKYGSYYETIPNNIEANLAMFPKESFYSVGGADETLNKYSSLCILDILIRLDIVGKYKFYLDQAIKTYSTEHPRPDFWSENEPFNGPWQEKQAEYVANPVLNYL